jgi:hypothetical protein
VTIGAEFTDLRNRAWTTSGSRHNAARRLRTRSKLSLATIALVSAIGVAVPLVAANQYLSPHRSGLDMYASLLSLFILVVAIIEGAAGFDAKADALFSNAERLNSFRMRMNVFLADADSQNVSALRNMIDEYEQLKASCTVNHEVVDFYLFKARNPTDFGLHRSRYRLFFAFVLWVLYSTWWLALIELAAVVGLWVVLTA